MHQLGTDTGYSLPDLDDRNSWRESEREKERESGSSAQSDVDCLFKAATQIQDKNVLIDKSRKFLLNFLTE